MSYRKYICIVCEKDVCKKNVVGKYCSHKCQRRHDYELFIDEWLSGNLENATRNKKGYPSKYIYRYFYENVKYCEICALKDWLDMPITLELDHIDGNRFNNSRENLRMLCPNCHSQTVTFRNKKR